MKDPEVQELVERCVFCRIVRGEEPAEVMSRSEAALTIRPLNPVTKGQLLVVPRHHGEFLWEIPPQHLAETMVDVEAAAWQAYDQVGGVNVIQSNGASATQTIGHVHFHIVPRREDDGLFLPWTGQSLQSERDQLAGEVERLKAEIQDLINLIGGPGGKSLAWQQILAWAEYALNPDMEPSTAEANAGG